MHEAVKFKVWQEGLGKQFAGGNSHRAIDAIQLGFFGDTLVLSFGEVTLLGCSSLLIRCSIGWKVGNGNHGSVFSGNQNELDVRQI